VRKQLYSEDDDKAFFNRIKAQLKQVEKRLEEGRCVLQHLEVHLINVACDDPGAVVGAQLALPLLQEALEARALEHAAERARAAEDEVLRMEVRGGGGAAGGRRPWPCAARALLLGAVGHGAACMACGRVPWTRRLERWARPLHLWHASAAPSNVRFAPAPTPNSTTPPHTPHPAPHPAGGEP
jgi:hypothetical protein